MTTVAGPTITRSPFSEPNCHDHFRRLLERLTLDDCFSPEVWRQLLFFGLVIPDGDVLPIRTAYDEATDAYNIALNPLKSAKPLWYAGPNLLASTILTGKVPNVVRAYRPVSEGQQSGLQPARLRGAILADPRTHDFFRVVIEQRSDFKTGIR